MAAKGKRKTKRAERYELLSSRFSNFEVQTKLTDKDFKRIEKAGSVELDVDRRAAIQLHLQQFEFSRRLEGVGYGQAFRRALRALETNLEETISYARLFDGLPGHLWSFVTHNAGVNADTELQRLEAIRDQVANLNASVDEARRRKTADPFLPRLLEGLEREFNAAGGGSTGIARGTGRRGGRFLRFCEAALSTLPQPWRPTKGVSARWDQVLRKRERKPTTTSRERIWVGRPHPSLART